jgi:hypothetical protein
MKAYPGIPISHAHCVCHWCVAAFEILRSDLEGNRGGRMLFRDSAKSPFPVLFPSPQLWEANGMCVRAKSSLQSLFLQLRYVRSGRGSRVRD